MPQRNAGRVAQLLSNNNLLSGTCVSGLSATLGVGNGLIDAGVVVAGSNKNNSSTNPSTSTVSNPNNAGITPAANGRHFGNPVAAAAAAAAAAASATASSSSAITNISAASASSAHHQHQPQPPPLITDTLNACLDVNGTYICTSYSPRCYIIQKVTPNTITVTPHVIPGEAPGTSGIPSNNNSLLPLLPPPHPPTSLPASVKKPGGKLSLSSGANPSSSASHLPPLSHHSNAQPPPPPPPYGQQRQYHHHHNSPQQQPLGNYHAPLQQQQHHHHHHPHHHHHNRQPTSYSQQKNSPKSATNYSIFQKASVSSPMTNSAPPGIPGRVYMNGEVGSSTAVFSSGEESIPAMVHQSATAAGAGTHYTENRILNGLKDGTREQMKPIESAEIDFADSSRRHDPGSGANTSSDLPKEELKRLLLQQLEYYFSPENLANDKFLVSQMDSDHYVYISTLANFNMVKKLTGDIDLVTEVLRDSKNVQVHSDGKRVRPVSHRTVVILRGIPESTPVDEIKALFDSENCPKCNSCEFAFNDSWYISFESDEDAQRAHRYLREDVKEFKGQPIMARIKSRPTTLLAQGAGVHMKNGFHQPPPVMGPYLPPAFVPGSQTGPSTAVPQTPMYGHGQTTVPSVFQMPPNYNYGHWPGLFGMPEQYSQMYPMNGLAPQHQPSSNYPKTLPMNQRPRNPNQVRPRRPPPSSSENQGINGVVGAGGTSTASVAAHQSYSNPSRKNNNAPPPPSLLSMIPNNPPALPLANPTSHNHSQGHLSSHSSVQVSGNAISQNGRQQHYVNPLPSSHSNPDSSYHPSGSMRPYRGGVGGDSRPRSSLSMSNRKGPPRREEEVSYDGPSASPSLSAKVPSSRGAPPNANIPVPPPPTENVGSNQPPGKINFDLEGAAFPPLPGSGQSYGKNGDAVFEGRLSDVVKGVKNMKTTSSSEKDDSKASATNVTTEIIVSAEENQSSSDVREVSAASPIKEVDVAKRSEHASSQTSIPSGKKEFREVGVGSADDTHDIRSSHYKSSVLSGARSKETADKSTRTDEALLNGDQSQGVKTGVSSVPPQSYSLSQNGGARKSASQTTSTKSPISSKRAVPALQVQNASSSVSVGPEVPYSSRTVTSPVTTHAKSTASQTPLMGGVSVGTNMGNSIGRGANAYVAKSNMDNNNSRANGMVTNSSGSNLNTVDKEAFPSPGFGKPVPTTKPFPTTSDQASKEATRTDADKDKRESGQGDAKKEDCSNDERDGPMRLSYAQVAQVRKDGTSGGGAPASGITVSNSAISVAGSSASVNSAPALPSSSSSTLDEKKKPNVKDTKEARPPLKNQRGSGGGDRDRDRGGDSRGGFRRGGGGFRNRMMSDHSDGGSVTSGESTRRIPNKPSRSPNK